MKKTLLFVGLLLIILVIFSNFQEGLEIPETDSTSKKRAIFEELLKLKDTQMSVLENTLLLSVTFRQSIHNYITPEELKSKSLTEFYNFVNSDHTTFKTNIQNVKGISESTKLNQLTASKYTPLFYDGFNKLISDVVLYNNTSITTGSTIRQVIDVLRAKENAEGAAALASGMAAAPTPTGTGAPRTPTAGAPAAAGTPAAT